MTIAELKDKAAQLQRSAPASKEAKEAQRAYQAALNDQDAEKRAAVRREEEGARKARQQELDFARTTPRTTATISLGVFSDWATSQGFAAQEREWRKRIGEPLNLGYVVHDTDDGSRLCGSNVGYPCKLQALGKGAHVSDQPHGRSGWHLIATVELAPELQFATALTSE